MGKNRPESKEEIRRYIRLVDVTIETDMLPAWQPEIVEIQGKTEISRNLVGTRDVWMMAFAKAQELIDPRNKE